MSGHQSCACKLISFSRIVRVWTDTCFSVISNNNNTTTTHNNNTQQQHTTTHNNNTQQHTTTHKNTHNNNTTNNNNNDTSHFPRECPSFCARLFGNSFSCGRHDGCRQRQCCSKAARAATQTVPSARTSERRHALVREEAPQFTR